MPNTFKFKLFDFKRTAEECKLKYDKEKGLIGWSALTSSNHLILENWAQHYYNLSEIVWGGLLKETLGKTGSLILSKEEYHQLTNQQKKEYLEKIKQRDLKRISYEWNKKFSDLLLKQDTWNKLKSSCQAGIKDKVNDLERQWPLLSEIADYPSRLLIQSWEHLNIFENWLMEFIDDIIENRVGLKGSSSSAAENKTSLLETIRKLNKDNYLSIKSLRGFFLKEYPKFTELLKSFKRHLSEIPEKDLQSEDVFLLRYLSHLLTMQSDILQEKTKLARSMLARLQIVSEREDLTDGDLIRDLVNHLKKMGLMIKIVVPEFSFHDITEDEFNSFHDCILQFNGPLLMENLRKLPWFHTSLSRNVTPFEKAFNYFKIREFNQIVKDLKPLEKSTLISYFEKNIHRKDNLGEKARKRLNDYQERLQFIIKHSNDIRDLNDNLIDRFKACKNYALWFLELKKERKDSLIEEKSRKEQCLNEKNQAGIRDVIKCILLGCTRRFQVELLETIQRLPIEPMSPLGREIFLLLTKLLQLAIDKPHATGDERAMLIDILVEKLKAGFERNVEMAPTVYQSVNMKTLDKLYTEWYSSLYFLLLDVNKRTPYEDIISSMLLGERTIHPVYKKKLSVSGSRDLSHDLPHGQNHRVERVFIPLQGGQELYCKFKPDAPGDEFSVRSLFRLTLEPDMPLIDLAFFSLKDIDGICVPVQISQGIKGKRLDEYWNQAKAFKLDHEAFSRSVLLNLITGPLDLKPENVIVELVEKESRDHDLESSRVQGSEPSRTLELKGEEDEPSYRLRFIDNDQCFMPPIYEEAQDGTMIRHLGIKTVVFCFDEMRKPLDQKVLDEFLNLDISECLRSWIIEVSRFNKHCARQFSAKDLQTLASLPDKEAQVIMAQIEPDLIENLYNIFITIKEIIKEKMKQKSCITGIELLNHVYPELGPYYVDVLKDSSLTPSERFRMVVANEYQVLEDKFHHQIQYGTSTSINTVAKVRYGHLPDRKKELKEAPIALDARLDKLNSIDIQVRAIDTVVEELKVGINTGFRKLKCMFVREAVISKIKLATLSRDIQVFIGREMAGLWFRSLDLENCDVEALKEPPSKFRRDLSTFWEIILNSRYLRSLKLNRVPGSSLSGGSLEFFSDHFEYLENLKIQGVTIQDPGFLRTTIFNIERPINFYRLGKLDISKCTVRKLNIDAPELFSLKASDCVGLTSIWIVSPKLRRLDIGGSKDIKQVSISTQDLSRVQMTGCDIRHGDFYEKFPFLFYLNDFLKWVPEEFVQSLNSSLTKMNIHDRKEGVTPSNIKKELAEMIKLWSNLYNQVNSNLEPYLSLEEYQKIAKEVEHSITSDQRALDRKELEPKLENIGFVSETLIKEIHNCMDKLRSTCLEYLIPTKTNGDPDFLRYRIKAEIESLVRTLGSAVNQLGGLPHTRETIIEAQNCLMNLLTIDHEQRNVISIIKLSDRVLYSPIYWTFWDIRKILMGVCCFTIKAVLKLNSDFPSMNEEVLKGILDFLSFVDHNKDKWYKNVMTFPIVDSGIINEQEYFKFYLYLSKLLEDYRLGENYITSKFKGSEEKPVLHQFKQQREESKSSPLPSLQPLRI